MSFLVVLFLVVLAVALIVLKLKPSPVDGGLDFAQQDTLFTPAERSFLGVLEQALDGRYRVFGKVRLGDIVKPAKGLSNSERTTAQNKVNQKHVDFVICAVSDLAVVGVVELDDKSHERDDRADRDQFVDRALADAGIPFIHFSAKKGYMLPEVRAKLADCFAIGAVSAVASVAQATFAPEKPADVKVMPDAQVPEIPALDQEAPAMPTQETAAPVCPKCEAVMVKRQAAKGPQAGKFFWACSAFPKCRQVVAIGEN